LISGQTHHMEHIVRTLGKSPELAEYIENGYDDDETDDLEDISEESKADETDESVAYDSRASSRAHRLSKNGEELTPDTETRLYHGVRSNKRFSTQSIVDVADRHLRDKTDAIAHIIRNISEQCAAAVEGLQLAHDAEVEAEERAMGQSRTNRQSNASSVTVSDDGETGDEGLHLHPSGRNSIIPPTPDLVHNRSSTAMSISSATTTPERGSQQYTIGSDIPTKIVEDSDREIEAQSAGEEVMSKAGLLHRPSGARISALGGH